MWHVAQVVCRNMGQNVQTRARAARNPLGSTAPACLNGCSSRLDLCTCHTVASAQVTCLRHSSNGRPNCAARKFPQEQVSSAIRRRTKRSTSPGARGTPYASASVPCTHCTSPAGRTRPRSLGSPTSSLTRASGHDVACDSPAKENVGYVMVRVNSEC